MGLKADPPAREFCPSSGKARLTRSEAKRTMKRQSKRKGTVNLMAYQCRSCHSWHVGNRRDFG